MSKRNRDYWKKRMIALENEQYQRSAAYYKDVQEKYRRAKNNIQIDIEFWYRRLAENNDISYAGAKKFLDKNELEEFHWTVEQYIKAGQENAIDQRWMKQLENASARHHISYLKAMKYQMQQHSELLAVEFANGMLDYLHKTYEEQYYSTAFEIAKGVGVGTNLAKVDTSKVELLLKKPWAQDGRNFSDRIWTNKDKLLSTLHTELTQSIIRGASPQKAIDNLAKAMNVSKSQAGNLIMTESAAISSRAQQDCFEALDIEEFEVVETLDEHTCTICRDMDGKHFAMSDFVVGETAPPFHPRCRGCTCPHFDDEFTVGEERAARGKDGETYYVPANTTYKEWKQKFVDNPEKSSIIKASGALTDKNDPSGNRRDKHADTFYNSIRNGDKESFVNKISRNTGISKDSISKVYDHVFCNEHELYGGMQRFAPDYYMAESFRRLREGKNIQAHDIILLKHERLEYELMSKTDRKYQESHDITEKKYNYRTSLNKYLKENNLF